MILNKERSEWSRQITLAGDRRTVKWPRGDLRPLLDGQTMGIMKKAVAGTRVGAAAVRRN